MPSRSFRRPLAAALRTAVAALLLGGATTGCGHVADIVSPGRSGLAPARLALAARLPALQQAGVAELRVTASYDRTDGAAASLGAQTLVLGDARTQDVPVQLDLGPCLADAQRQRPDGGERTCAVRLALALLLDGRVVDEQTLGPLTLAPGVTTPAPAPITLFDVRTARVDPPAGAVLGTDGSVRLEVGATLTLAAVALDPSGQPVAGRAAAWTSATPAVATVNATTGAVTGVAPGTARITAVVGGREAALTVRVAPRPQPVAVVVGGSGSGTVVSTPAGVTCRVTNGQPQGECTATFPGDATVSLLAVPQQGSGFAGWGDACAAAGTATTCVVTADSARTVRATFGSVRTFGVSGEGDGVGTVLSSPAGLGCTIGGNAGGACTGSFLDGTTLTLTASAGGDDRFVSWGGACATSAGATCTVVVGPGVTGASVRFARPQGLTVTPGGTGEGTVSGGAIACARRNDANGGTCAAPAPFGTVVSLTATPEANSTFAGWTGACSGTGACSVTVDEARTVGATFTRRQVALTVTVGGAGGGTVAVGDQRCTLADAQGSATCTLRVDVGRALALSATPATGSEFTGWAGTCAASARAPACALTLTGDASVGATFVPGAVRVTVGGGGGNTTGGGSIASGDGRIACVVTGAQATGTCEASFAIGSTVTLTASPDPLSGFDAWSGACAGTTGPRCTITVTQATSAGARFIRQQATLTVGIGGSGAGTVSLNGAPFCTLAPGQGSTSCTRAVDAGSTVTLALQPAAGSSVTWGGPCAAAAVTGPCTFTAAAGAPVSVPVSFALIGNVSVRPVAGFTGGGRVQSPDQRIDCTIAPLTGAISGTCDAIYATGAPVTLALTSFTMPSFAGAWSGLCTSSTTTCSFTAPAAGGVARLTLPEFVNLSLDWTGAGSVATAFSDSAGRLLTCSGLPATFECSAIAPEGSTATFTAVSSFPGWFQGWTDGCAAAGTAPTCTRTVPFRTAGNPPYVVGARFDFEAVVDVNGAGTVALQGATGPNSACTNTGESTTCSLRSPTRTATFVATPASGNVLTAWDSFSCVAVVPTCTVDVTSANGRVSATFQPQEPVGLEFDRDSASTGEGRVITSFGSCNLPLSGRNGACSEIAQTGSTRSYTAQPFAGSQFVGWGGPCEGQTGTTCTLSPVLVGGTITARFDATATQLLTVQGVNSVEPGTGTVTSAPAGIACSMTGSSTDGTCAGPYPLNTNVTLTATPQAGSVFAGWSGDCAGNSPVCVVTMGAARTARALFLPAFSN